MHCSRKRRTLHTKGTIGIKQFYHNEGLVFFLWLLHLVFHTLGHFHLCGRDARLLRAFYQVSVPPPTCCAPQGFPFLLFWCTDTKKSPTLRRYQLHHKKPLSQTAEIFKFSLANDVSSTCWFGTCPRSFRWTGKVGGIFVGCLSDKQEQLSWENISCIQNGVRLAASVT